MLFFPTTGQHTPVDVARDLIGEVSYDGDGIKLTRVLPSKHPLWPSLYGSAMEMTSFEGQDANSTNTFDATLSAPPDKLILAARGNCYRVPYVGLPYRVLADADVVNESKRYVEVRENFSIENIIVPAAAMAMKWVNHPAAGTARDNLMEGLPKTLPSTAVEVVLHRWPHVPYDRLRRAAGLMNSAAITISGSLTNFTARRGTLLFASYTANHYIGPTGLPECTITLHLNHRDNGDSTAGLVAAQPAGWNFLFRPSTGQFHLATHDGTATGRTLYNYIDFIDYLFNPSSL